MPMKVTSTGEDMYEEIKNLQSLDIPGLTSDG
jgi:hypothetical protein